MKKFFHWLPRILSILFILFISIFALDVFKDPQWFLALLIHLIPSFILIIMTIIAWKRELLGGCMYVVTGLLLLLSSRFESMVISVPALVIGALFLFDTYLSKK